MAEDFQQKWDQMHQSIKEDVGLTKVRMVWTILQCTPPIMAFRPPAVRSTLPGLQTCQPVLAPRRNSWTRTVRQEALDAVLVNLTQCTAGPDQRIFGKGGGSIKGGKVQRKAGATGSADGAFKCNFFNFLRHHHHHYNMFIDQRI